MGLGRMRRAGAGLAVTGAASLVLCVLTVFLVASSSVRAASRKGDEQSVIYETVFAGSYSFGGAGSSSAYGTTSQRESSAAYGFNTVTDDTIKKTGPGRVTEYTTTRTQGVGDYRFDSTSSGSTPVSQTCTFGGQGKRASKPFVQAPSPERNPLLTYSWELPDATGHGLSWSCGSGIFLPVTPTNAYLSGTPTLNINDQAFGEAFSGSGSARYKALPVSRDLDATITATDPVLDPAGDTIGSISSHATVAATVAFLRFAPEQKGRTPPKFSKIGQLLLESTLETLGIAAGGSSPIGDGDPTEILVPAAAPGTVTLTVTGGVISHDHIASRSRLPQTAASTLFTGSGQITSALGQLITLRPSPAAHAALSGPHPSVPITMRATFTPSGGGAPLTATRAGTIAATTDTPAQQASP